MKWFRISNLLSSGSMCKIFFFLKKFLKFSNFSYLILCRIFHTNFYVLTIFRAKTIHPEDKQVNFALALCYYKKRNYDKAIQFLERYCLGDLEHKAGKDQLGVESTMNYLYLQAVCYKGKGDFTKSESIYRKFKKL